MTRALAARACLAALVISGAACSDDPFEYEGVAGRPIPAVLDAWVPGVPLSVDDGPERMFLVDTGAPLTMVDTDNFALESGKHHVSLTAFELTFPDVAVAAYDLFTYPDAPFVGILGGDVLRHFALSVDYQGEQMWLDDGWDGGLPLGVESDTVISTLQVDADVRGGGRARIPGCLDTCGTFELAPTRVLVEAEIEDLPDPVTLLVDTGASAVVLGPSLADALGDDGRPRLDGVQVGTAGGLLDAYFTRVGSLALDGPDGAVELTSVPALVFPTNDLLDGLAAEVGRPVDGIVGATFSRSFLMTIDYLGESLALSRYADPYHIDPDEYVGVGFTLVKPSRWEVEMVFPGTEAEAAGLAAGDVVADIDGQPADGLSVSQVNTILDELMLGDVIQLGIDRGDRVDVVAIAVEDLLPAYEGP